MSKNYKVTIHKFGNIPGIGRGPIWNPIYIPQRLYDELIKLGYDVRLVDNSNLSQELLDKKIKDKSKKVEEMQPVKPEPVEEIEIEEEPIVEEVVEEIEIEEQQEEEPIVEEEVEFIEVIQNDDELSADSFYTRGFLKSKSICKTILDNRKVQYEEDSSLNKLRDLVEETNP